MNLAEGVQIVSFAILSLFVIAGALGVVLLSNIVYSAFLLGFVFICISGLYILLNAGFVAAAQVLVYVGAVNVLILFGIMLVNKQEDFAPVEREWIGRATTAAVCVGYCPTNCLSMTEEYEMASYDRHNLNYDNVALGRLPYKVTEDPMVTPLRELAYLPKGVLDPHDLPKGSQRAGRSPQDILTELEAEKEKEEAEKPAEATAEGKE